jgi:hypothetical protein
VTSLVMHRAQQELEDEDVTLAVILSAVAVEGQMAYLFFKWKKVDSFTFDIANQWEKEWAGMRSIASRLDKLSKFLTGVSFDSFVQTKKVLLQPALDAGHYDSATSFRDFFQEQFFERRNKIVHYGEIDFQESDGRLSLTLASSLIGLLDAMDQKRIAQMDEKHKKAHESPPMDVV